MNAKQTVLLEQLRSWMRKQTQDSLDTLSDIECERLNERIDIDEIDTIVEAYIKDREGDTESVAFDANDAISERLAEIAAYFRSRAPLSNENYYNATDEANYDEKVRIETRVRERKNESYWDRFEDLNDLLETDFYFYLWYEDRDSETASEYEKTFQRWRKEQQ